MSAPDLPDLLGLSEAERIQLAQDLWDSIPHGSGDLPLAPELRDELDRRLAAHHADPASAISWDEAKAELRRRFAT